MSAAIDQYREAKSAYLKLRNQAKKELLARFNEVASELLQLQKELLEDFGEKVSIPAKPKKARSQNSEKAPVKNHPEAPAPLTEKAVGIQKQIERQKARLSQLQTSGKPTKATQDRIYELEDELRLLQA